jgi:hypothetical protein
MWGLDSTDSGQNPVAGFRENDNESVTYVKR